MENNASNVYMGNLPRQWDGIGIGKTPKTITFSVTEDCNLACKYCYMTGKNHEKKMTFETAKKAIDYILGHREQFDDKSVIWDFIGGEPFLQIELIDKICDYLKQQMFLLDHPWFNSYRFSFSTNGLLYDTPEVQKFIRKNYKHVSIGISVDGNKEKHDLQRVHLDGSGSYDEVVKNVPLWMEQFPDSSTKATFAHEDIPLLKDSVISLWNLGIKNVAANVVFEDVWEEGDDIILEQQLKELGDYVLEHELWKEYSVRFFNPTIGTPLSREELNRNFCGAGSMLAIDCDGNFAPCVRFLNVSLNHRPPIFIGNAEDGIDEDKIRPFLALDVKTQSLPECVDCDVATGCAWCQGCNYDLADTDTIYQRAIYLCKMHKATVRANKYFWNKFEEVTGLPSRRKIERGYEEETGYIQNEKYLQFITSDQITPHCSYENNSSSTEVMSKEMIEKGMEFCRKNQFIPAFFGEPEVPDKEKYSNYIRFGEWGKEGNTVSVADTSVNGEDNAYLTILRIEKKDIPNLKDLLLKLFETKGRIDIIIRDPKSWNQSDLDLYKDELKKIVDIIVDFYKHNRMVQLNILTDLFESKEMNNCDAGETTFSLAPNGKIYVCPGFYFDNPDSYIGTLEDGIHIKNPQLLSLDHAPICAECDVYSCSRCKFLNKKLTLEINTPSKNQCLISHIQRAASVDLQKQLLSLGYKFENIVEDVDYNDPLEMKIKKREG